MRTVFKYPIEMSDAFTLFLPVKAVPLTVQPQGDAVCLWALVDPNEDQTTARAFRLAGTGHPIDEPRLSYIGTFQLQDGALVFHLFEVV